MIKLKNTSNGSAVIKTVKGFVSVKPDEVVEINERDVIGRIHHCLIKVTGEQPPKGNVTETVIEDNTTPMTDEEILALTLKKDESVKTRDSLENKLKSLKSSWKRATRPATKEKISKEIKEVEKQIAQLKE